MLTLLEAPESFSKIPRRSIRDRERIESKIGRICRRRDKSSVARSLLLSVEFAEGHAGLSLCLLGNR